jgi:long-chain acyl-CoA synthetase
MKKLLGGKVEFMVCGGAPIATEVLEFMKIAFCCPLIEVYGQTEGCGAEFCTSKIDPVSGFVGGPFPCVEYKLIDVPELGYTSKDKDKEGKI